jgi:hypothetical protein
MKTNTHLLSYLAHLFLEWEMFQTKVVEKKHILCSVTFFENCAFYERTWNIIVERDVLQLTTWRMRIASWIAKATNTHRDPVFQGIFIMFKYLGTLHLFFHIFFLPFFLSEFKSEFHLWRLFNNLWIDTCGKTVLRTHLERLSHKWKTNKWCASV